MTLGRMGRARVAGATIVVGSVLAALGSAPPAALAETCKTGTATFEAKGEQQCYEVPAGVSGLTVAAVGGKGGSGLGGVSGGFGALVSAQLSVAPSQTLYVEVGSNGCSRESSQNFCFGESAFGGGGAPGANSGTGGGASDVREKPAAEGEASLLSRLLVAGGGGGGGSEGFGAGGGSGGSGDAEPVGAGGAGKNGGSVGANEGGEGGKGATSAKGGEGGKGGSGFSFSGEAGLAGALGTGGTGYYSSAARGGGGGGGGLYGGGAGGRGGEYRPSSEIAGSGGGGAGSSFAQAGSNPTFEKDTTGTPEVTITPVPSCTSVLGKGTFAKTGQVGRFTLIDELNTSLSGRQYLHIGYIPEAGHVAYKLLKLEGASCRVLNAELRVFEGFGTAEKLLPNVKPETGYELGFLFIENAGGMYFKGELKKGATLIEPLGGPLKNSTEKIG